VEAIQAGPRLLVKGQRTTGLRDKNRSGRSVVCRDRQGRVLLGTTSAGFRGLTLQELQQALLSPLVACVDALNLDGGGSAQLFVAPRESSTPGTATVVSINGFDTVPVALALIAQ
jgi:exopolysaccharide biosynthesis protein